MWSFRGLNFAVAELTSPWVDQFANWLTASWFVGELSSKLTNDGTKVDNDKTLAAVASESLMLLTGGELWLSEIVGASINHCHTWHYNYESSHTGRRNSSAVHCSTSISVWNYCITLVLCRCYHALFGLSFNVGDKLPNCNYFILKYTFAIYVKIQFIDIGIYLHNIDGIS